MNKRRILSQVLLAAATAALIFRGAFLLYFGDFYHEAQKAFPVPGLSSDFVPQGLESFGDGFLISGYLSRSGRARLYHMDALGGVSSLELYREDGTPLRCHAGGVAAVGDFVYLVGGGKCYVFSAEEIKEWDRTSVSALGSFSTGNRASFCCIWNDALVVGEYANGERYPTAESHHLMTPSGEENPALGTVFPLDEDAPLGVEEEPGAVLSLPDRVQGLCLTHDGRMVLSTSGALGMSKLYLYDRSQVEKDIGHTYTWSTGEELPVYFFDSAALTDTLYLPPQTEETTCRGGMLYVLFESASYRYQYGKLVGTDSVYRMPLPDWEPETEDESLLF